MCDNSHCFPFESLFKSHSNFSDKYSRSIFLWVPCLKRQQTNYFLDGCRVISHDFMGKLIEKKTLVLVKKERVRNEQYCWWCSVQEVLQANLRWCGWYTGPSWLCPGQSNLLSHIGTMLDWTTLAPAQTTLAPAQTTLAPARTTLAPALVYSGLHPGLLWPPPWTTLVYALDYPGSQPWTILTLTLHYPDPHPALPWPPPWTTWPPPWTTWPPPWTTCPPPWTTLPWSAWATVLHFTISDWAHTSTMPNLDGQYELHPELTTCYHSDPT